MKRTVENELLLLCVQDSRELAVQRRIGTLVAEGVDWPDFLTKADENHITPLVYERLCHGFKDTIPDDVRHKLHTHHLYMTQHNMRLAAETVKLIRLLNKEGVSVVPFKGPVQSLVVYGDMSKRPGGDVDLLVKFEDFPRAESILLNQSYEIQSTYLDAMQSSYWCEDKGVEVDLHYGIPPAKLKVRHSLLWSGLQTIQCLGHDIQVLGSDDSLLVSAINATKEYWKPSLHHFSDIKAMAAGFSEQEWKNLFFRAQRLRCKRALCCALLFASRNLTLSIPNYVADNLTNPKFLLVVKEIEEHMFFDQANVDKATAKKSNNFKSDAAYVIALTDSPWRRALSTLFEHRMFKKMKPHKQDYDLVQLPRALRWIYYGVKIVRVVTGYSKRIF